MAAPTQYQQCRQVSGLLNVSRVSIPDTNSIDLVPAVSGKTVYVLGILFTTTSSGTIQVLSNANVLLKALGQTTLDRPVLPLAMARQYHVHMQTNSGEALKAIAPNASEVTVIYVQE